MSVLPRIACYRFRLRDDDVQRGFTLPDYLASRKISSFYLRQERSDRISYPCGHRLHVPIYADGSLIFHLAGIADWNHEGRAHEFVAPIRETAARIFGTPVTLRHDLFNDLDQFSVKSVRSEKLPSLIERYVRELAPHFPITRGEVSYVHNPR